MERLRELCVLGVLGAFDHYTDMAALAGKMAKLEQELGGADHHLEGMLACINRIGEILRESNRKQQERSINLRLDKILVGAVTKTEGVEPKKWAQPLFADLLMVSGDTYPQGTSNVHHIATVAGLGPRQE